MSESVVNFIDHYLGGHVLLLSFFITFSLMASSIIGLHPIILVTIYATSFEPAALGITTEYFAILILASWGLSNTLSPASAVNNVLANYWNVNVTTLSYKWNYQYAIIIAVLLPFYLILVNP